MKASSMVFVLLCGFGLVHINAAPPANTILHRIRTARGTTNLEEFLRQCLITFIETIVPSGSPELNIPIFDPWLANKSSFPFEIQESTILLRADANATNITSNGMSLSQISSLDVNAETGVYNMSLSIQELKVTGLYSVMGYHHSLFPIVGVGAFQIMLYDVSSTGTSPITQDENGIISLSSMDLLPLAYGSAASEYENLSISGEASSPGIRIKVVNNLTSKLWSQVEEVLRKQLSDSLLEYLNNELQNNPIPPASLSLHLKRTKTSVLRQM